MLFQQQSSTTHHTSLGCFCFTFKQIYQHIKLIFRNKNRKYREDSGGQVATLEKQTAMIFYGNWEMLEIKIAERGKEVERAKRKSVI